MAKLVTYMCVLKEINKLNWTEKYTITFHIHEELTCEVLPAWEGRWGTDIEAKPEHDLSKIVGMARQGPEASVDELVLRMDMGYVSDSW